MYEYTWYQWLSFFYIYCFFGWIFESTYVSLKQHRFVNRGFLRLPMLPLYGTGAVMMLWVSLPFKSSLVMVYISGVIGATILEYVTALAMASREHPMVEVGISPRGTLFLDRMAKAHAYLEGRDYVTGGDVQAIFHDVCAHRVILNQKSRLSGGTVTQVLNELLETVEVPDRRQA